MNQLPDAVRNLITTRFPSNDSFDRTARYAATWALQSQEVMAIINGGKDKELADMKSWYEAALAKAYEFSGIIKRLEDADYKTVQELEAAKKEIAELKATIDRYKAFLKPLDDTYNEETKPI